MSLNRLKRHWAPADKVLFFAKEGIEYRKELKEEALKAGVRAMGDAFKKETWERNFDLMDIQESKTQWRPGVQAEAEIPACRQTQAGLAETRNSPCLMKVQVDGK